MNDPREAKLPRWAQEELAKARQDAADATAKLNAHLETLPKTSVWYGKHDNPIYIPDTDEVRWMMGDNPGTFDRIGVFKIPLHTNNNWGSKEKLIINGGRSLQVFPSASNTIYVDLVD